MYDARKRLVENPYVTRKPPVALWISAASLAFSTLALVLAILNALKLL